MIKTNLKYPEEKILSVSKTNHAIAVEHVAVLSTFGINVTFLAAYALAIAEAEALYNETKERYDLKNLTGLKNKTLELCYVWCQGVLLRLELAFGKSSLEVQNFPSKLMYESRMSETKLSPLMELIIGIADEHAVRLAEFGQDAVVLAEGTNLLGQLRGSDYDQELKKLHKKNATQVRHDKFNHLYNTVNKVNKVGRMMYKDDPANYVLFETPWGSHSGTNITIYKGDIQPSANLILAEGLDADSSIYMENTGETDLLYSSGIITTDHPGITLSPGEESTLDLSEIGAGDNLSVENLNSTKTGEYTVKI